MEVYSRVEDSEMRSITIHIIFLSIYYRKAIYRFIILYYPIIEATDYKVIGGPSETRMRSAKQNQDFHRKACISLKAIWHKIKQSEQITEINNR